MAIVTITVSPDVPDYRQRTSLDGRDYILALIFNQRLGRWYLDVEDQDAVPIVQGVRVVTNYPLIARVTDERRPPGELYMIDLEGSDEETPQELNQRSRDAGLREIGSRFALVYLDAEELGRT